MSRWRIEGLTAHSTCSGGCCSSPPLSGSCLENRHFVVRLAALHVDSVLGEVVWDAGSLGEEDRRIERMGKGQRGVRWGFGGHCSYLPLAHSPARLIGHAPSLVCEKQGGGGAFCRSQFCQSHGPQSASAGVSGAAWVC